MEHIRWERLAAILLCCTLGVGALLLALRFLLPLLLPFLLAWLVSLAVRPLAARIARVLHLPVSLCAVVLLAAVIFLGAWGLWVGSVRLLSELSGVAERLIRDGTVPAALDAVGDWLARIGERLGLASGEEGLADRLAGMASKLLGNVLSALSSEVPEVLGALLSALPSVFFVVIVTVIAGFYFCVDGERIRDATVACLPTAWRRRLFALRDGVREVAWRYARAYLLLLGVTCSLLLIGFLILRVEYAFLLSILIAVADLLPVIGVGTVMVPWSVILLLQRNFSLGFGILILYLAVELVRQIAEPRLLGKSLGIHPLLTLFASYVGFRLFGLVGMLLAPIVACLIKSVFSRTVFQNGIDKLS